MWNTTIKHLKQVTTVAFSLLKTKTDVEREEQEFTEEVFRVFKREDAETGPFYPADSLVWDGAEMVCLYAVI